MHERIFYRHFFDLMALLGALGEVTVGSWLLAGAGIRSGLLVQVAAFGILAVANRLSARRLEEELPHGMLSGTTGHVVLACGVAGMAAGIALAGSAGAYGALRWIA